MKYTLHDKIIIEILQKFSPLTFKDLLIHFKQATGMKSKTLSRRLIWLVIDGVVKKNGVTKGVTYSIPSNNVIFVSTSLHIESAVNLIENEIPEKIRFIKTYLDIEKPDVNTDNKIFNMAYVTYLYCTRLELRIMLMVDLELPSDKQQFIYKNKVHKITTANLEMLLQDLRKIGKKYKLQLREVSLVFYARLHNLIFNELDKFTVY